MKKLLVCDVDGTLLFDRKVDPETVAAIRRWQQAGNLAVCNTGKSIFANQIAFKDSGINFDYYVLYTGAVVTDQDYSILAKKTLDFEIVRAVVDHLVGKENISLFATTLDHDYQLSNGTGKVSSVLPAFSPLSLSELENHEYVGIPIWSPDSDLRAEIFDWIIENFADRLDCHRNLDFLDIVPRGCDKGSGLKWLVDHRLAGEKVEVYTIGDSWNDLSMHAYADYSASFTHSPADVREATGSVVDHAHEFINGVLDG